MTSATVGSVGGMDYNSAHQVASEAGMPVRRGSWPEGHHVRFEAASSTGSELSEVYRPWYKLHTGDANPPQDWSPSEADQNAGDWEQHVPQHHS